MQEFALRCFRESLWRFRRPSFTEMMDEKAPKFWEKQSSFRSSWSFLWEDPNFKNKNGIQTWFFCLDRAEPRRETKHLAVFLRSGNCWLWAGSFHFLLGLNLEISNNNISWGTFFWSFVTVSPEIVKSAFDTCWYYCWWFRNPANHLGCRTPPVNTGINYQPELVSGISGPAKVSLMSFSFMMLHVLCTVLLSWLDLCLVWWSAQHWGGNFKASDWNGMCGTWEEVEDRLAKKSPGKMWWSIREYQIHSVFLVSHT